MCKSGFRASSNRKVPLPPDCLKISKLFFFRFNIYNGVVTDAIVSPDCLGSHFCRLRLDINYPVDVFNFPNYHFVIHN